MTLLLRTMRLAILGTISTWYIIKIMVVSTYAICDIHLTFTLDSLVSTNCSHDLYAFELEGIPVLSLFMVTYSFMS